MTAAGGWASHALVAERDSIVVPPGIDPDDGITKANIAAWFPLEDVVAAMTLAEISRSRSLSTTSIGWLCSSCPSAGLAQEATTRLI